MSLNKVRQLDDQQLIELLNENGYENIATILNDRNIDGKKLLELSEFQTRFWKLSALQQKTLFNFIEKINENPFIIIKREPIAKVNITLNLPTAPTYKSTSPPRPPVRNYQTTGPEFKHKLGISLGANSSNISPPSPNISPTKNISPRLHKPKPVPIEPIQNFDNNTSRDLNKKTRNFPPAPPPVSHENINSKQILPEHGKILKPLIIEKNKKTKPPPPTPVSNEEKPKPFNSEPARKIDSVIRQISNQNNKPKTKLLPMEPTDIEKIKSKPIMYLLNNENNFSRNSREGHSENEYENLIQINPNIEYGYLSANELEFAYENSDIIRMHATRNNVQITENFYKIAPSNPKSVTPPPEILLEPSPNKHNENKPEIIKKSPMADRPPLPLPKELSNNQSKSLDNLRMGMNDSDNYDSIQQNEIRQMRNNIQTIGGYLDLDAGNGQLRPSVNIIDSSSAYRTKYDPQNIIISEQDQLKRNNLLGTIGRLFTKKPETRAPTFQLYDYENYMLKSEVPSVVPEEDIISFKNRPLPEIPTSETRRSLNAEIPSFSSNIQEITNHRVTPYTEITQQDDEIYENLKGNGITNDNFDSSSSVISGFQKNTKISPKLLFQEELALKLSEALKVGTIPKQKTPTANFRHDIEDKNHTTQKHLYGNIDSITAAHQSRLRNNLASNALVVDEDDIDDDDFDEFDETPPPSFYENIESEPVQIEVEKPSVGAKMTNMDEHGNYYQIVNFSNEKFFKNTDRDGAKDLLKNLPDGSFLFRPSETYFLVLTLKYKGKCYNLGIERSLNNKIKLNADTSSISPEFGTLQAFVEYFTKEAITFRDHNDTVIEIFLNPVFRK